MPTLKQVVSKGRELLARLDRVLLRVPSRAVRKASRILAAATAPFARVFGPPCTAFSMRLLRSAVQAIDRSTPPRSVYAGTPIISIASISKAESLLGVKAETFVWHTYFLTHAFTYNMGFLKRGPLAWRTLVTWAALVWACLRYKRFHFFYDRGFLETDWALGRLQFREDELKFLRYLDKEIYFYAYGADVRTRQKTEALGPYNCCTECPSPGIDCICVDKEGERNYGRIARYATATFSMGDMIEYTPGSRNDLFYWPLDLNVDGGRRYAPRLPDPESDRPVRVVHAPNHRGFKGTRYLIDAVERLKAEGLPIELVLVERVPNREALEIYRTADLVFDQCLIGFHGYFALEAMAMGKPVMVYIRDPERYLLEPDECPLVNARADQVETVLRELVQDRARLHRLGAEGRRYIERHFSLEAYSQRLGKVYQELSRAA